MYNYAQEFIVGKKIFKLEQGEEFITLQSLLKATNIVSTGVMVKIFLAETEVLVNGERENRRGRKLYSGDLIQVSNNVFEIK